MDLGIAGRVALVTAASVGLGRGSAAALAAEGVDLVISARGEDRLGQARQELASSGVEVVGVADDLNEPGAPARLVHAAIERFGRLDIVVANNGGPPAGAAFEVTDEQVRAAVEGNLLASIRLAREALPHMRSGGWGRICCIASYSVVQPIPTLALSNLARTGLRAWAKTAAADLAAEGSGITLNLACPGAHATQRMVDLGGSGPMGDPSDFGKVVAFLCSEPARFVNGATVVVDGGATTAL